MTKVVVERRRDAGGRFKSSPEETNRNQDRRHQRLTGMSRPQEEGDWSSLPSLVGVKKVRLTESCRCVQHHFRGAWNRIVSRVAEATKSIMYEESMQEAQNKVTNRFGEKQNCKRCGPDRPAGSNRFTVRVTDQTFDYEKTLLPSDCWRNIRHNLRRCFA